ncbi:MAG: DUF2949 domain-containing protein [Leptolyngbyaceae bacterium]|nr:DUF2949 domain-containing protein [Leptolyngbyaceae bacterium]
MHHSIQAGFIRFLQRELGISTRAIAIALRHRDHDTQLPIILWQYGFVTIEQLDQIFSWLAMYGHLTNLPQG